MHITEAHVQGDRMKQSKKNKNKTQSARFNQIMFLNFTAEVIKLKDHILYTTAS